MSDLHIQIPDPLKAYVDSQIARRGYRDANAFVQELIEADQHRQMQQEIEQLLLETVDGPFTEWTDADLEDIRQTGTQLLERRRAK